MNEEGMCDGGWKGGWEGCGREGAGRVTGRWEAGWARYKTGARTSGRAIGRDQYVVTHGSAFSRANVE